MRKWINNLWNGLIIWNLMFFMCLLLVTENLVFSTVSPAPGGAGWWIGAITMLITLLGLFKIMSET